MNDPSANAAPVPRRSFAIAALIALAHAPALALLIAGRPWLALAAMFAVHAVLLWGTLWPHSRLFGPVLRRLPANRREVWLTIDDGPSDDTPAILDLLARHRARATFFLVAERAERRPELVRAIRARGHEIGNHSATHPAGGFWIASPRAAAEQVGRAQVVLTRLAGTPPRWFRAVVGHANPFVDPALRVHGLARVSWSARGYDGVAGDVERVAARIARGLAPGAIVLLHEGARHGRNVAIVARVLEELSAFGYRAVLPAKTPVPETLPPCAHHP